MSGLFARLADVVLNPKTGWKTTHFWGPVANWGISGAAIYDMRYKELDMVSLPMTGTLAVYSELHSVVEVKKTYLTFILLLIIVSSF